MNGQNAMSFLVTAGNTRERIDQVRDWGNIFTGNTGYSIARALARIGPVELLTSNRQHLAEISGGAGGLKTPHRITGGAFTSHAELLALLEERMGGGRGAGYEGVFMSAAVADYKPAGAFSVAGRRRNPDGTETWIVRDAQAGKVKSDHSEIAILGERTRKLVDLFRSKWNYAGLLVKFKLEVGIDAAALLEIGRKSRTASGADYLVANTLDMVEGENAGAYLIGGEGERFIPRAKLAEELAALAPNRARAGSR